MKMTETWYRGWEIQIMSLENDVNMCRWGRTLHWLPNLTLFFFNKIIFFGSQSHNSIINLLNGIQTVYRLEIFLFFDLENFTRFFSNTKSGTNILIQECHKHSFIFYDNIPWNSEMAGLRNASNFLWMIFI